MAVSTKTKMTSDKVLTQISDGSKTIELDLYGEQAVIPTIGSPTVNKFISQFIKANSLVNDGTYEAVTLTVTWSAAEEEQIMQWQIDGTMITYTVTGYYAEAKTWNNCFVRLAAGASPVPGEEGYKTMQIEITCLDIPQKTTGDA